MRRKIKPNLDLESIQKQLLDDIVQEYDHTGSINKVAKNLGLSNMKVRKALITAGVYSNATSEEVERDLADGKSIEEISARLGISVSAVYGYIPYKVTAYNLEDRSVSADRIARYRERQKALKALKSTLSRSDDWQEALWSCIVLYQGQKFKTSGRGSEHKGAVGFTYSLKTSGRTGEKTDELVFSTREQGKTVTRSSVERAFETAIEIQQAEGYVSGPKKIGGFGASYLYAIFLKWGVIKGASPLF